MTMEIVWIQNLKGFVRGVFPANDRWKRIFIEQLDNVNKSIEAAKPQPINTAIVGNQIIACEPFYGWLIVAKQADGSFQQKTSGNYWLPVPEEVEFTKWLPYPGLGE